MVHLSPGVHGVAGPRVVKQEGRHSDGGSCTRSLPPLSARGVHHSTTSGGLLVNYRSGKQSKGRYMRRTDNAEMAAVQGSDGSGAVPLGDRDDDCVCGAQR